MENNETLENIRTVKSFFAAIKDRNAQDLLAILAEDIVWIIPGEDWALAGTHRAHTGVVDLLKRSATEIEMSYPKPPEFVAQGDRVLAIGSAEGRINATKRTFEDDWIFCFKILNGKISYIREYMDTQALARAS